MFEFARAHGIKVGALVGTVNHALNQARAGVDVLMLQAERLEDTAVPSAPWFGSRGLSGFETT